MQKRLINILGVCSMLLLPMQVTGQISDSSAQGDSLWVQGGQIRLFARAFSSENLDSERILVVVLHGDAPPPHEHPSYQYVFASKVAETIQGILAVGLLRPGYSDPQGNRSEGERGQLNGDNWNARNTDAIAETISQLKSRYHVRNIIVVGHSGGAAITANILGRHPELIDAALLVSCPCGQVEEWRKNMLQLTGIPVFEGKIDTLSPIDQVKGISENVAITLMVGTKDKVAPPRFSEEYVTAVKKRGKNAKLVELDGRPHNTFLDRMVLAEVRAIIERLREQDIKQN